MHKPTIYFHHIRNENSTQLGILFYLFFNKLFYMILKTKFHVVKLVPMEYIHYVRMVFPHFLFCIWIETFAFTFCVCQNQKKKTNFLPSSFLCYSSLLFCGHHHVYPLWYNDNEKKMKIAFNSHSQISQSLHVCNVICNTESHSKPEFPS